MATRQKCQSAGAARPSAAPLSNLHGLHSPIALMIARILFTAFMALTCAGCGTAVPGPTTPSVEDQPKSPVAPAREEMRDLTAAEKAILADGFTAGLENADSVKFRWTRVPKRSGGHSFDYCGLINLKTSTGYTGMRPFHATVITENEA